MMRLTPAQAVELLRGVEAETTVITGDGELPALRRCAGLIRSAVPRAVAHELAGAGHLCLLERPAEAAALLETVFA